MRFFRYRTRKAPGVELSEQDGVRHLHVGGDKVQSAMRLAAPNELELAYTRCMMGFLLFNPRPERVLMIGLGGGSLAKFIYHRLPWVNTVAVEISEQVLAAARSFFELPPEDERFRVVIGDGAGYVAREEDAFDVILTDGYVECDHGETLVTPMFYDRARLALTRNGILVTNFLTTAPWLDAWLTRMEAAFEGRVLLLEVEPKGNLITFALNGPARKVPWADLKSRAKELEETYGLPFREFVSGLRKHNPHTDRYLNV